MQAGTDPPASPEGKVVALARVGQVGALLAREGVVLVSCRIKDVRVSMAAWRVMNCPSIEVKPRTRGDSHALVYELSGRGVGVSKGNWRSPAPHFLHQAPDVRQGV